MKLIDISELFGKSYFETYSEFYLMLEMAGVAGLFDCAIDASKMSIDTNVISDKAVEYFKMLVKAGIIYVGQENDGVEQTDLSVSDFYVRTDYFPSEAMYDIRDGEAYWSFQYAEKHYKNYHVFSKFEKLGYTMLSLVSYFIIRKVLGLESASVFHIDIDSMWSKNIFIYANLYSCGKTMPWFSKMIDLQFVYSNKNDMDIDYYIFCTSAFLSKKIGKYTISEKGSFLKELGMQVGSILILYERVGMCENNRDGHIKTAKVIRLDEIGDDFIGYCEIALNKTKEENRRDYMDIDEDMRDLFSDMLYSSPNLYITTRSLYTLGIDQYFGDENYILTRIDPYAMVSKIVTINGMEGAVDMSEIDAIYWLLCQYNIEFNRDIYKEMYSPNEDLLWDKYGEEC